MPKFKRTKFWSFRGANAPPAHGSRDGGDFVKRLTGSAAIACGNDGMALTLDATSEAQAAVLYLADVLPFDIDEIVSMQFVAKLNAAPSANVTIVAGLASAYNATEDSIAANAWFRLQGSSALLCETDDGATDKDDIAADGITLTTAWKRFKIDFSAAPQTVAPPGVSKAGKGNVQFHVSGADGMLTRVARGTLFDLSAYSAGLQPYFSIRKASSTETGILYIDEVEICYESKA
jgi:hypothetical protein